MNKLSVTINPTFEDILTVKVRELINLGQKKGQIKLDENRKGTLDLFIDDKPTLVMLSFDVDGHKVYIGGSTSQKAMD